MYDAIVIGARCAGSPAAMLLAREGYRVLVVEKARIPSDVMSTHFIQLRGVALLEQWGLRGRIAATGCPPVSAGRLDFGPVVLKGSPLPAQGVTEAYAPRRYVLDGILAAAAGEAGAEVREAFVVDDLLWDGDRVAGVRGRGRSGAPLTEHARMVIGADGLHSLVARLVQASVYNDRPSLSCGYYTYWSDVPVTGFEIYFRERRIIGAFPTNDGLTCMFVGWPHREFASFRADIEGNYLHTLDLAPDLAERVRQGRRVERFVGTADLPNFFRKPYGSGWALVGDAGYHKDPLTAQGISDAFRDAALLAEAIDAGFAGRDSLENALALYERRRNEAAGPIYEFTCQQARLESPPPEMRRLLGALRGNQQQTNRFLGLLAGTTPFAEFFAPESIGQIMSAAA